MRHAHDKPLSLAASFEKSKSDYAAAKQSRFRRIRTGIQSLGSGGDYHYRNESDYLRMMEYARDMDRNDSIIGRLLDTATQNIVQNGIMPDPKTGDTEADEVLLDMFTSWATDPLQCSLDGTKTFADLQELAFRAMLCDGDIFALPTTEGSLQLVEAHRCRTPSRTTRNVIHGILLDDERKRVEYWFTKDDIDPLHGLVNVGDTEPYAAFDDQGWPQVYHLFNPKRVTQTRGVTALAPVFDVAGMFEDINFAKLIQQQIVSCFAIIRNLDLSAVNQSDPRLGDKEVEAYADGARKIIEQIAPGMEITGNPGETIEGFSPNIPNPGAMEHFRLMLQLLGVNLGIPLIFLMLDGSETNFTGWRGAADQARIGFRRNHRWLIDHFLRPIYRWKVRQWTDTRTGDPRMAKIAARLEAENRDIYKHGWTAPTWAYIQPLQDAQADRLRVTSRQTSPRRQLAERGLGIDDIHKEIIEDNYWLIRRAIKAAQQIEAKTGVAVDWHELLYVPNTIDQKPGLPASPITSVAPEQEASFDA